MSRILKLAGALYQFAKPVYRKYHIMSNDAPTGTVPIGNNLYMDFGGIKHKEVGNRLVEIPSDEAIEVIVSIDETNASAILGYHPPELPDH